MRLKRHEIRYEETMQSISQHHYGSTDNWVDLIEFNDLEYPYIVGTTEEKKENLEHLVTYGDTIIIPINSSLTDYNLYKINKKDQQEMLDLSFGMDIDMLTGNEEYASKHGTSDEILGMSHSDDHRDLRVAKGIDNMKQVLSARLLTARGSLLTHPDYGSDLHLLFGKAIPEQALLIEQEVMRCLTIDKRVRSVRLEGYTIEGDVYKGEYTVELQDVEHALRFVLNADSVGVVALFE